MTNGKPKQLTEQPKEPTTNEAIFEAAEFLSRNQDGSVDLAARGGGGATNDEIVERALQSALGGAASTADPAAFAAALGRTTATEEVDGQTRTIYRRPTGAGPVLADALGALTGAQATLYSQAQDARAQILELLDRLTPLALTPDPDAVNDLRSLLKTLVNGVAEELGQPGGPTVPRVDHLFAELVGRDQSGQPQPVDPENLDGVLLRLQDAFGMERGEISSLEDERVFTDFNALVREISALLTSWLQDRKFLEPLQGEPFLGTQLVQIERALEVVGQAVEEAYDALDRAQVEQTERDVSRVPIDNSGRSVSLGQTLAWARDFAHGGRERLKQGGRDGIGSVAVEAVTLQSLIDKLVLNLPSTGSSTFTLTGIGSQPVRASLTALGRHVKAVKDLAIIIRRPKLVIASVELALVEFVDAAGTDPAQVIQRRTLILRGRGFGSDTRVDLFEPDKTDSIPEGSFPEGSFTTRLVDDEQIVVDVDAEISIERIRVTNDDGSTDEVTLDRPDAAPLVLDSVRIEATEVADTSGLVQRRQKLTLLGGGFGDTTSVILTPVGGATSLKLTDPVLLSDRHLEVVVDGDVELSKVRVEDRGTAAEIGLVRPDPEPRPPISLEGASLSYPAWIDSGSSQGTLVRLLTLVGDEFDSETKVTVTHPGSDQQLLLTVVVTAAHLLVVSLPPIEDLPFRITVENPSDGSSDVLILERLPYDRTGSAETSEES